MNPGYIYLNAWEVRHKSSFPKVFNFVQDSSGLYLLNYWRHFCWMFLTQIRKYNVFHLRICMHTFFFSLLLLHEELLANNKYRYKRTVRMYKHPWGWFREEIQFRQVGLKGTVKCIIPEGIWFTVLFFLWSCSF